MADMGQTGGNAAPAGWYPDPAGTGGQRWWDGARWTGHLLTAPSSPPPPAQALEPQPTATAIPALDPETRRLRRVALVCLLLELLAPALGLVPLVVGVILYRRGRRTEGAVIAFLALAIFAVRFTMYARTGFRDPW
jgi:hypothetical protein